MSCDTTTNIVATGPAAAIARLEARMRASRRDPATYEPNCEMPFSPANLLSDTTVRNNVHTIMRIFEVDPATNPSPDFDTMALRMRLFRMKGKTPDEAALRIEIDSNYFTYGDLGPWMSAAEPDLEVTVYLLVNEPPWHITTYRAGQAQPQPDRYKERSTPRREIVAYSPPPPTTAPQTRVRGGMTVGRHG